MDKNIFTELERDIFVAVCASIFLFIGCLFVSQWIMPEHCELFSSNIENGFACDGVDITNPRACPTCENSQKAVVSSIVAGLGIVFLLFPIIFYVLRRRMDHRIQQNNIFH